MKRVIKASSFKPINRTYFVDDLVDALKQLLPKNCYPTYTYRSEIEISKLPTKKKFETAVVKACYELGYTPYDYSYESDVIAAVKGDAYAKLFLFYDSFDKTGYINVHCDTGNVILEDWYQDGNIIQATTKVTAAEVKEIPPGYLKTSKFTAPSIKTWDQQNAAEAFDLAVTQKFAQFDKMMDIQMHLTSDTGWTGKIDEYEQGYYVQLEATRSSFNAFVSGDSVIRKPRDPGEKIGTYDVSGNAGAIYFMSRRKTR